MGSFATRSWSISAILLLITIYVSIMRSIRQSTLKKSLPSWNLKACFSLQMYTIHLWLSALTHSKENLIPIEGCTAGVIANANCNQLEDFDIVAKKNASTANRGVLNLVCYYGRNPLTIIAHLANSINSLAVCYV